MNSIEERIRGHVDAGAAPITIEEITDRSVLFRLDSPPPRRSSILAIAAAGVLVVGGVVAVGAVAGRGADAPATQPPEVTGRSFDANVGVWTQVADPQGVFIAGDVVDQVPSGNGAYWSNSSVRVNGAVTVNGEHIAVGTTNVGFRSEASVWRSPDGRQWSKVASPGLVPELIESPTDSYGLSIDAVATDNERAVAVGVATVDGERSLRSWTSDDTETWQQHSLDGLIPAGLVQVTGVAAGPEGFVAVGFDNADSASGALNSSFVLRSADGAAWERVDTALIGEPGTFVMGITNLGNRLVAYGSVGGHNGTAAAWFSDDGGISWNAAVVPADSAFPFTSVQRAVAIEEGLMLLGDTRTAEPRIDGNNGTVTLRGDQNIVAWSSVDGATYTLLDTTMVNSDGHDRATAATNGIAGLLFAADRSTAQGPSTHLWTWSPTNGFTELDSTGLESVTTLSPLDDGYLAATNQYFVGQDINDTTSEDTTIWTLPIG